MRARMSSEARAPDLPCRAPRNGDYRHVPGESTDLTEAEPAVRPPGPRPIHRMFAHREEEEMAAKDHGPSIKDDEQYEALRREGMSKEKAARIANESASTSRSDVGRRTSGCHRRRL
jgi:hypothetical protein